MADSERPAADAASGGETVAQPPLWRRLKPLHWLVIVLGTSVVAHCLLLCGWRMSISAQAALPAEIPLGTFEFIRPTAEPQAGQVQRAAFELHVGLLSGVSHQAGAKLQTRKYRVQQNIEELLRQAHAADFEDPQLTELKRQLQEKINATLEMRAIEEVIITDLQLQGRLPETAVAGAGATEAQPQALVPDTVDRFTAAEGAAR